MPNTARFTEFFNDLFDLFNTSAAESKSELKKGFRGTPGQMQFLREARKLLNSITVRRKPQQKDVTKEFSWIKGWLLNISSLQSLWQELSKQGFPYLLTRKLTQDGLEHFFGRTRLRAGQAGKLTPNMYSRIFHKLWGLEYLKIFIAGNCELIEFEEGPFFLNKTPTNSFQIKQQVLENLHSLPCTDRTFSCRFETHYDDEAVCFLENNAATYVRGWFYSKSRKLHNWSQSYEQVSENGDVNFIFSLEKQSEHSEMLKPPDDFVRYFNSLDEKLVGLFNNNCHTSKLSELFFEKLKSVEPFNCCANYDHDRFLMYFIRIRIYWVLRSYNRELAKSDVQDKISKKILMLKHL